MDAMCLCLYDDEVILLKSGTVPWLMAVWGIKLLGKFDSSFTTVKSDRCNATIGLQTGKEACRNINKIMYFAFSLSVSVPRVGVTTW